MMDQGAGTPRDLEREWADRISDVTEKSVYTELAERLGAPRTKRFLAVIEEMFTAEEARICLELMTPATCPELASRLQVDETGLKATLENLVARGVLTQGRTQYAFHKTLVGFHHDLSDCGVFTGPHALPEKVKKLWEDFFREEWSHYFVEYAPELFRMIGQGWMIWPAIGALERSPNITPDQLLPQEDYRKVIETTERRIIGPCGCRVMWGTCDKPLMTCVGSMDSSRGVYYLDKPGRLLKEYTLEETLALVREAEEAGLVHWGQCYCCDCDCEMHYGLTQAHRYDLMPPNRFLAVVDEEQCTGCQDCIEKCPFDAIEMKKPAGSKRLKSSVSPELCKGCGVCIVGCEQQAMRYEIVRPPEYITDMPGLPTDENNTLEDITNLWGYYDLD